MWQVLVSAFGWLLRYVLGRSAMKWAFGSFLLYGVTVLVDMLLTLFPAWFTADGLSGMFSGLTPGMWYFFDYFQCGTGLKMTMGAYATRFLIRRLPIIG